LTVDAYEFQQLPPSIAIGELKGTALYDANGKSIKDPPNAAYGNANHQDATAEYKPHFHEWASATPGMICVARRARNASFRNYVAAETASPVIVCAACQPKIMEDQFFFAGVCRSKSVRPVDDGIGPSTDEYFTMAIGGMVTLLNNSSEAVWAGDWIAWTFFSEDGLQNDNGIKRQKKGNPRRVGIELADPLSDRTIGRCVLVLELVVHNNNNKNTFLSSLQLTLTRVSVRTQVSYVCKAGRYASNLHTHTPINISVFPTTKLHLLNAHSHTCVVLCFSETFDILLRQA
jgi:hypothetical protein